MTEAASGCVPGFLLWPVRLATGQPRPAAQVRTALGRGLALRGRVWPGGGEDAFDDGVVVVDSSGYIAAVGPARAITLPDDLEVVTSAWVGPGIVDAHVHLSAGSAGRFPVADELRGGLVAVRDLGAPPGRLDEWHLAPAPTVAGAGPRLVGHPAQVDLHGSPPSSVSVIDGPAAARRMVAGLVVDGVDLVKVVIDGAPASGRSTPPDLATLTAIVHAAHAAGLPVTAHALTVAAVAAALDAGVDELAHVPTEALPPQIVERIAAAGIGVVSTLQCHAGEGQAPGANAAALHRAGVPLIYGTDLGNTGTRPGVDPRELDRLAFAGLGRVGALLAATTGAARAVGFGGRAPAGRLKVGTIAAVVALTADPLVEPAAWRHPAMVVVGQHLVRG